jgi:hypothetical protein
MVVKSKHGQCLVTSLFIFLYLAHSSSSWVLCVVPLTLELKYLCKY